MTTVEQHLAESLKGLRQHNGLSQIDASVALGVMQPTISRWESGLSRPDLTMLVKIADLYKVSVDDMLGRRAAAKGR